MKRFLVIIVLGVIVVMGAVYAVTRSKTSTTQTQSTQALPTQAQTKTSNFANPAKSAHWESNTPEHGSTLAGVPVNVVINFNFDLVSGSSISIQKDGKEYGVEGTIIDPNKLALRRAVDTQAPDGLYTVVYKACWPDGSCHDGSFQFVIDRTQSSNYLDVRAKKEVTIILDDIAFAPKDIWITRGTKVTWINNDSVEHYINTDFHPAHTYYLSQNSQVLGTGDSYSLTLETAGIYPYHCSAHAASMVASILVD